MKFPLNSRPVPWRRIPFFNLMYLAAPGRGGPDPSIVWTSEFECEPLQEFVRARNQHSHNLVSTSHALTKAVGVALVRHPELNRRIVGRRIYEFKDCNVCLATRVPTQNEVKVIQIHRANQRTVEQIAYIVFKRQLGFVRQSSPECKDQARLRKLPGRLINYAMRMTNWLDGRFRIPVIGRLDRLRESSVLVNDYSHPRFPVMRGYKPSRHPFESNQLSVTLGKAEEKVAWDNGRPIKKLVAPITARVDHRIADGFQLGLFIKTISDLLSNPSQLESTGVHDTATVDSQPVRTAA